MIDMTKTICCAGIDVGGTHKGYHLVILKGTQVILATRSSNPQTLVHHCLEHHVGVTAVDAPCKWRIDPKSPRLAEREMAREHISCFSTPTREKADGHAFYGWMFNGERMFQALAPHYPILEERKLAGIQTPCCIETFPHAVTCTYLGAAKASAKCKNRQRRALLQKLGIDTTALSSIDYIDASLCALSAQALYRQQHKCWGNAETGYIIVPKPCAAVTLDA